MTRALAIVRQADLSGTPIDRSRLDPIEANLCGDLIGTVTFDEVRSYGPNNRQNIRREAIVAMSYRNGKMVDEGTRIFSRSRMLTSSTPTDCGVNTEELVKVSPSPTPGSPALLYATPNTSGGKMTFTVYSQPGTQTRTQITHGRDRDDNCLPPTTITYLERGDFGPLDVQGQVAPDRMSIDFDDTRAWYEPSSSANVVTTVTGTLHARSPIP